MFVHIVLIERMSLVMTFLGFHHVFVRCHTMAYPQSFRIIGGGLFVHAVFIEDMSHCYDIF